jgi:hypothetical protein
MSNFSYKDGNGRIVQIPVMYGDPSRQAASVLKKNSENTIPSAPFIACYIKGLDYDQTRLQDPTFVSKVQVRERAFDEGSQQYLETQGLGYTVERIMPAPYKLTFTADIWTTNTDQKLQIIEQLAYLFNPSLELQTTDNYLDWTSLTVLTLTGSTWTSRAIPQGTDQNIDIATLTFETPIWITPPAKVKRMGIITKIIANVFSDEQGVIDMDFKNPNAVYPSLGDPLFKTVVTPGGFELLVLDNVASLLKNEIATAADDTEMPGNATNWRSLLDLYPGKFRAGLSQLRLRKPDNTEIVAYISLDNFDERKMNLSFDTDTIPGNTIITTSVDIRGTIDAIIDPETFVPSNPAVGIRYLILENLNADSPAWQNADTSVTHAVANDIIQWTGTAWEVIFNSSATSSLTYITNSYTGIQYKWDGLSWSKSFEGIYDKEIWRLVL